MKIQTKGKEMSRTTKGAAWIGIGAAAWLALAAGSPARADEALFGYLYTTDSLPQGHWEFEQWATLRTGKARGSFTAVNFRDEIEYGVTDRLSGSLYLNTVYINNTDIYDPEHVSQNIPDQDTFDIQGVSSEWRYRVLSPYTDPIGLSLYAEPEIELRDMDNATFTLAKSLETRLILQKNFDDDLVVTAANFMFEPEWELNDGVSTRELWFEATLGASYRFMPSWSAGLEFRNHREFPNMDFGNQEHSAFFLGPNVHYGTQKWWATLTVLPQIGGYPQDLGIGDDGQDINGGSLHLGQHEKLEVRFKAGVNL